MQYCANCGNQIDYNAAICVKCGSAVGNVPGICPMGKLKTNRGVIKYILLSMITFGIYGLVVMSTVSTDINIIAGRYDGKKTMHYCLVFFLLGPITCGIFSIIWMHGISQRIGDAARARNVNTDFGAGTFWLWNVLGSMIVVGPFIYLHKLCTTMNAACESYNRMGC